MSRARRASLPTHSRTAGSTACEMAAAAAHGDEEVQDDTVVGTINELIDAKIIESVIEDPRNEFVRKFGTSGTEPQKWMAERMTGHPE